MEDPLEDLMEDPLEDPMEDLEVMTPWRTSRRT